jgi:lipoprotein-anchoring transpeptidase ErfK/SrfK
MVMVRNESVGRIVMFLCFGTAILSLAAYAHNNNQKAPSTVSTVGAAVAMGASIPETSSRQAVQVKIQNAIVNNPFKSLLAKDSSQQTSSNRSGLHQTTRLEVDLTDRRVYVYRNDQVIASYPIGVGKKGWETPTGSFQVLSKITNPIWRHPITGQTFGPGHDSPLGDRWISFWSDGRNQIGFHGTPEVELVGSAISHGCLRMRNPDIRMLYKQVQMGTPVVVRS